MLGVAESGMEVGPPTPYAAGARMLSVAGQPAGPRAVYG